MDLNLLRIFVVIYQERNLSRAAVRMHLSQPAISHALARLRLHFDDVLFVRAKGGMQPTRMAQAMFQPVENAIQALQTALRLAYDFEPERSDRRFRVAFSPAMRHSALPRLYMSLRQAAPSICLDIVNADKATLESSLYKSVIDAAICPEMENTDLYVSQKLYQESFLCVGRKITMPDSDKLDMPFFLNARHIKIDTDEFPYYSITQFMRGQGKSLRYVLEVDGYQSLKPLLEQDDVLLVAPQSIAYALCQSGELTCKALPFLTPQVDIGLHYPNGRLLDAGALWLYEHISALFTDAGPG